MENSNYSAMLEVAIAEARRGLAEGGIPIGAAIFDESGKLVGAGHNRRVQNGDPSLLGFGTLIVGESRNFQGGVDWLRSLGVRVIDLNSQECVALLADYIRANPAVWNEDIGQE